jgi:uncharacterized protein
LKIKVIATILSIYSISFFFYGVALTVHAQSDLQTTKYRNIVIDLGNGLKTNARLNLPANGEGPYPAVLLVPGSGLVDMNETLGYVRIDNETGSKIYPPRPFYQIAEYLSERGFAVLQYDKRGVGANSTILDSNVWGNVTFDDLKQDAEKALDILIQQPEVDASKVTLVGHSEGTMIAPRVSIDNPDKVDNIVLMGAIAQNLGTSHLAYFQGVTTPLLYLQQVLDHDHNGLISVSEASEDPVFSTMGNLTLVLTQNITTADGTSERLHPQYDMNNDTLISINDELKPRLIDVLKSLSVVTPGEKCLAGLCPIWLTSQSSSIPTLDIISKVPLDTSILIQQGKNDSQTPIQQAFLLQQKLTEVRHPDHILITYPDLGHLFYPSSQWLTAAGPMDQKVLQDLFGWLSDPVRDFKEFTILLQE